MKFAVAINMERFDPTRRMDDVTREVLHLVQMADRGGFETAWAAEHHTIEFDHRAEPADRRSSGGRSTPSASASAPPRSSHPTGIRSASPAKPRCATT